MAKHPHRLLLNQKKTWRCTLPGCKYFIHIGLAHILPGQQAICWECGQEFTLDEDALKDDMPICADCRARNMGIPANIGDIIEAKLALGKAGVKTEDELTPQQRNTMRALGVLPSIEKDEIEVDDGHAPECSSHIGGDCDCC